VSIVVEDGNIVPGANSYGSVADADAYFSGHELESTWTVLDNAAKEKHLKRATRYLDLRYHARWVEQRVSLSQVLDWPRINIQTRDGFGFRSNQIPPEIPKACFEAAVRSAAGDTLIPDIVPGTNAGSLNYERVLVGPIEQELHYSGARSQLKSYPSIELLLQDYTTCSGTYPMERG
jgi:hypothetical protein